MKYLCIFQRLAIKAAGPRKAVGRDGPEHADNTAVQAYLEANDRMHEGMTLAFTGDADVDFGRLWAGFLSQVF